MIILAIGASCQIRPTKDPYRDSVGSVQCLFSRKHQEKWYCTSSTNIRLKLSLPMFNATTKALGLGNSTSSMSSSSKVIGLFLLDFLSVSRRLMLRAYHFCSDSKVPLSVGSHDMDNPAWTTRAEYVLDCKGQSLILFGLSSCLDGEDFCNKCSNIPCRLSFWFLPWFKSSSLCHIQNLCRTSSNDPFFSCPSNNSP